jgi:hypothetical protein
MNWRYEAAGARLSRRTHTASTRYSLTRFGTYSTVNLVGYRFPWTTGAVTVTALGDGAHKTIQREHGYDNRDASGVGTVQMVTPLITLWQAVEDTHTAGIGILQIEFVPEPTSGVVLASGGLLLLVLFCRHDRRKS